jgi:hypothetical protein
VKHPGSEGCGGARAAASAPLRLAADGIVVVVAAKSCLRLVAMVAAHLAGSTRPRARSSLPLSLLPMMGGTRGASDGLNVHHRGETGTQRTMYNPLFGMSNVEV